MSLHFQLSFKDIDVAAMPNDNLQEYTGVTPDDLVDLKIPQEVAISSNGKYVVYALHDRYTRRPHAARASIWVAKLGEENSARALTSGKYKDHSPHFGFGDKCVTFVSDRHNPGKSCAIYQLQLDEGFTRAVGLPEALTPPENTRPIAQYSLSPTGEYLAYVAAEEKSNEQRQKEDDLNDAKVYGDNIPFARLMVLDLKSKIIKVLVRGPYNVQSFAWSYTGSHVIYVTTSSLERNSSGKNGNTFRRAGVKEGVGQEICHFPGLMSGPPICLHDKILFLGSTSPGKWNSSMAIYSMATDCGKWKRILCGIENDAGLLTPVGHSQLIASHHALAAAVVQHALCDRIALFDARGNEQSISPGPGYIVGALTLTQVNGVVRAAAVMAKDCSPWEIFSWTYEEGSDISDTTQLSSHSKALNDAYCRVVQSFGCKARDGQALDAILVSPSKDKFHKPKGTIVNIHGGPYERSSFVFDPTMYCWAPLLVSLGYAVLCPNYRGSSGHGDDFAVEVLGKMGDKDFGDIVDMVHAGIKQGLVHADKILVAGWSQGGFLSFLAATRHEFPLKGAICGAGISDWDMLCMSSDAPWSQTELAGTAPWLSEPTNLRARQGSAVWHMAQTKQEFMVPLLLLHGEEDIKVPITQTVAFHRGCLAHDWPCQLVTYPREGHIFEERTHALDMLQRIATFADAILDTKPEV